jgi:hypothetical protein
MKPTRAQADRALDAAFACAVAVAAYCALGPFNGTLLFQGRLGQASAGIVFFCLLLGVLRALFSPSSDARACAVAAGLGLVYLASLLDGWARSSAARAASALAEGLSATRFELPWLALLMAVALGALGWLQFFAVRRLLEPWSKKAAQIASVGLAVLCSGLLLRALVAYSSGSASFFETSVG